MADFIDNLVSMMLGEGEDGGVSGGVEEKGKEDLGFRTCDTF